MLTQPPLASGAPAGRGSAVNNRLTAQTLLQALGSAIGAVASASGTVPAEWAEWCGTTLIRWAEQDRAEMRRNGNAK